MTDMGIDRSQLVNTARDLIQDAARHGIVLRALGGVGVALRCGSAWQTPLARELKDLDLVGVKRQRYEIQDFLTEQGLRGDERFNALHGDQRLVFFDDREQFQLDIFINRLVMCHTLELADRMTKHDLTLDVADLLLTKLQVVETNERDYKDILALLVDHDIDTARVTGLLGRDWGWWRTATRVLADAAEYAKSLEVSLMRDDSLRAVARLEGAIEAAPKSNRWRFRAKVGERIRWYELPEEVATS